ncbi:MAG TPA: RNA polymerase sigma factor [Ferruginibacter sp.]|nr:RNA polymerase sigma factor [Ferruginibacter sp.]
MPEGSSVIHIVHGCAKADRESQKAFYKMFYGFSMAICMRYCNAKDDAMEVVNDGFIKIYRELHNFKPAYDNYETSLKGWMKSIMVNTAIDHFRKNNKKHFLVEINDDHLETIDIQETSIDKLTFKEIMDIVQRLSPGYRTVFNLYVIDGFKHEEIAQQLNITVGTSKSNLAKAKMNIQKMLKETEQSFYEQRAV